MIWASVRSSALLTKSAALSPDRLMRMSSGPSSRKEKPRAGLSNWNDETPRSSTTPSLSLGELVHAGEFAFDQSEAAAEMLDQRLAARDGVGIAVDAQHAAIGGFQNGAGIAAAAEGAVDIVRAVARRQRRQHFRSASRADGRSCVTALRGQAGAFQPRLHARQRFGLDRRIGVGIPDLEFLRHADKGDAVLQPACSIIASGRRTRP